MLNGAGFLLCSTIVTLSDFFDELSEKQNQSQLGRAALSLQGSLLHC